jgi:hypothetical protein
MHLRKILLSGAVAIIPFAAGAQDPIAPSDPGMSSSASGQASFKTVDTDGDGRISRIEASSDKMLGKQFNRWDKNADGYLDSTEYGARSRDPGASPGADATPGPSSNTAPDQTSPTPPGGTRPRS